jgi:hypothetical protein
MTEFTKDDIEHYRKQYALWTSRGRITPEELHLIGRLRDALDHIEQLQKRVQELEAVNEDQALTISQNDYAYAVDKEMMEAEIKESNDLLRSAFMIAKRDGKETNWEAFRNQV